MNGRDHLERCEFWIGAVDVIAANDDIFEAFLSPLIGDVASEFVIAHGAGDVRLGGEEVMLAALFVGRGNGFELGLDSGFMCGGCRCEAEDRSLGVKTRAKKERCDS